MMLNSLSTTSIKIPEKIISRRSHTPCLMWPTLSLHRKTKDIFQFPTENEVRIRYIEGEFRFVSQDFEKAIRSARERIWLIDGYLSALGKDTQDCFASKFRTSLYVTDATSIRFVTTRKDGYDVQQKIFREIVKERRNYRPRDSFNIYVRYNSKTIDGSLFPHDRFAIIDDELWHCGANVGGTYHKLNAYSRGWCAHETKAIEYFERIWDRLSEVS